MLQYIHTMMAGVVFASWLIYLSQYMFESHIRSEKTSPSSCGKKKTFTQDKIYLDKIWVVVESAESISDILGDLL